jgi:hypothetical protein
MSKLEETTQAMIDSFTRGTIEAFNAGRQLERGRLAEIVTGHLAVCNYKAATEEDCDVCYWAKSVVDEMAAAGEPVEPAPRYQNDIFNDETKQMLGRLTIRKQGEE